MSGHADRPLDSQDEAFGRGMAGPVAQGRSVAGASVGSALGVSAEQATRSVAVINAPKMSRSVATSSSYILSFILGSA
ncbi:MAG: hypothetical protein OXG58_03380 [Gemmatimonadetes bacterium]|nr:hypothetical protein [Gemmatimonadota bacterium]MCY3943211.1 hypothetical protein [Gemmatimonadota bacterium]